MVLVTTRSLRKRRTLSALGHKRFYRMTGTLVMSVLWNARRNDPSAKGLRYIMVVAGVRTELPGSVIRSTPVARLVLRVDLDEVPAQRHAPLKKPARRDVLHREARKVGLRDKRVVQ